MVDYGLVDGIWNHVCGGLGYLAQPGNQEIAPYALIDRYSSVIVQYRVIAATKKLI